MTWKRKLKEKEPRIPFTPKEQAWIAVATTVFLALAFSFLLVTYKKSHSRTAPEFPQLGARKQVVLSGSGVTLYAMVDPGQADTLRLDLHSKLSPAEKTALQDAIMSSCDGVRSATVVDPWTVEITKPTAYTWPEVLSQVTAALENYFKQTRPPKNKQ